MSDPLTLFDTTTPALTAKPILRYPGGKSRAIKVLDTALPHVPIRTVLSPFLGGGSYELYLAARGIKVTAYDGYAPLVNFWRHLLTTPDRLADAANALRPLTAERFKELQAHLPENHTTVDDAAAYLAVNRSSFSGSTLSGGFSREASEKRFNEPLIERVRAFHNPNLNVGFGLADDTVRPGYDFIFADPPYWLEGNANKLYGNKGSMHDGFDHESFYRTMSTITSPWLITYNDSPELRDLWKDYRITSASWAYGMNSSKQSSEVLIRNY